MKRTNQSNGRLVHYAEIIPSGLIFREILYLAGISARAAVPVVVETMGMATFNQKMVAKIQEQLLAFGGASETGGDGETAKLRDLKKELAYWENRVAAEQGKRPVIASVDMSGC